MNCRICNTPYCQSDLRHGMCLECLGKAVGELIESYNNSASVIAADVFAYNWKARYFPEEEEENP